MFVTEKTVAELDELIRIKDLELAKQCELIVKLKTKIETNQHGNLIKENVERQSDELNARISEMNRTCKEVENLRMNLYEIESASEEKEIVPAYFEDLEAVEVYSCQLSEEYSKTLEKREHSDKVRELENELKKENKARLKYESQAEELSSQLQTIHKEKLEYDKKIKELAEKAKREHFDKVRELEAKFADYVAAMRNDKEKQSKLKYENQAKDLSDSLPVAQEVIRSRPVGANSNPTFHDSAPRALRTHLVDNLHSRGLASYGVCNQERISELQKRNSLCPPHLKSSYPVETQVLDPRKYKEDNLKKPSSSVESYNSRSTCGPGTPPGMRSRRLKDENTPPNRRRHI